MSLELRKKQRAFKGWVEYYKHESTSNNAEMTFAIYNPDQAQDKKRPVLLWLSGLTCTEENFMTKAGAQQWASDLGVILVAPDTSSRNNGIEGEDDSYDFGSGAGFYVNATESKWSKNYNMYDYVTKELPKLINENFNTDKDNWSVSGHSMGGHGALICALKNPGMFKSVSAFSPIVAPMQCPWGQKAFTGYLGEDKETWKEWDSCELISSVKERVPMLVDQGLGDEFLKEQLMTEKLEEACKNNDYPVEIRMHEDYDHSYYFMSSFFKDHMQFHAKIWGLL